MSKAESPNVFRKDHPLDLALAQASPFNDEQLRATALDTSGR